MASEPGLGQILPCTTEQTRKAGQPHLFKSGNCGGPAIILTSGQNPLNRAEALSSRVFFLQLLCVGSGSQSQSLTESSCTHLSSTGGQAVFAQECSVINYAGETGTWLLGAQVSWQAGLGLNTCSTTSQPLQLSLTKSSAYVSAKHSFSQSP